MGYGAGYGGGPYHGGGGGGGARNVQRAPIHTTLNPDKVPAREVERASNRSWSGTLLATTSQDGSG